MKVTEGFAIGIEALAQLDRGVCVVLEDGTIQSWGGLLVGFGVEASDAEGRSFDTVVLPLAATPELRERLRAARIAAQTLGRTTVLRHEEFHFPAAHGVRLNICLTPLAAGGNGVALVFEDVTESARTRERFETILNSTPDGIFVIDSERRVRLFNRACGELTGRTPQEIVSSGCTCDSVVKCHNEEGESYATGLCPAKSVFRGEAISQSEEMLLTNANGEERWVETNYSAVRGRDGEVEYVIGILRDVHERKLLEEKLRQTEKLASFGQLVAGIAHEIKNPLAIIQSSLDILRNPARSQSQKDEATAFIGEEVRRMDDRLRSFLAFARPRELRVRPLILPGWLKRRAAALDTVFPGISFHIDTTSPEPLVNVDEEQLNQVLTNLVLNAAEAMGSNGSIWLRSRQANGFALLEVEDSGPGIPEELRPRIFDPFFTTKANGTGLGLSICYQIVLAHRGSLSISTGRQGGACFTLRFPTGARVRES